MVLAGLPPTRRTLLRAVDQDRWGYCMTTVSCGRSSCASAVISASIDCLVTVRFGRTDPCAHRRRTLVIGTATVEARDGWTGPTPAEERRIRLLPGPPVADSPPAVDAPQRIGAVMSGNRDPGMGLWNLAA